MNDKQDYAVRAYEALLAAHRDVTDFAEWLTRMVATVATKLGGVDALTAGRPGSWEAAKIQSWMESAGVGIAGDPGGFGQLAALLDAARDSAI